MCDHLIDIKNSTWARGDMEFLFECSTLNWQNVVILPSFKVVRIKASDIMTADWPFIFTGKIIVNLHVPIMIFLSVGNPYKTLLVAIYTIKISTLPVLFLDISKH